MKVSFPLSFCGMVLFCNKKSIRKFKFCAEHESRSDLVGATFTSTDCSETMLTKELVLSTTKDGDDVKPIEPLETNYRLTIGNTTAGHGWSNNSNYGLFGAIDPIPSDFNAFFTDTYEEPEKLMLATVNENFHDYEGYFGIEDAYGYYYKYNPNNTLGRDVYQPLSIFNFLKSNTTLNVWISQNKPTGGREVTHFTEGEGTYTLECDTVNVPCQYVRVKYTGDPNYPVWFNFSMEYDSEMDSYHFVYEKQGRLVFDKVTEYAALDTDLNSDSFANYVFLPFLVYFFKERINFYEISNSTACLVPAAIFMMMRDTLEQNQQVLDFFFGYYKTEFDSTLGALGADEYGDLDMTMFADNLKDSITLPLL